MTVTQEGRKRSPIPLTIAQVLEAGLANHVIAELLGITSRRRSGRLGATASGDAVK
jgi:hypothetical protein